ncbi:hypothetical protein LEP1GSC086_0643 [Leptospira weilii str. LNT 1234]|nr:hypothetical protein LEP1GSC086_0643 [Leptospira weilii str. LNT 1234]
MLSSYGFFFILPSTIIASVLIDFLKPVTPGRKYTFPFPRGLNQVID